MKKIAALLVALALCVSVVALFASCKQETSTEDTKFIFTNITDKNGNVIACSVSPGKLFKLEKDANGAVKPVEIPAESPAGVPVTSVKRMAFSGYASIKEVVLPSTVTAIENLAFEGCTALTSINFPAGLTTIGNYAFDGCEKLTGIQFPEGLTTIGIYAFRNCSALKNIALPNSLQNFDSAFYKCTGLTSVTFGSITNIGEGAFYGCSGLQTIQLPDTLTEIKAFAFQECTALRMVDIPESVTAIGKGAFKKCSKLTDVTFHENSKIIALEQTFSACTALTNISLPPKIQTVGESTFENCSGISEVYLPATLCYLDEGAFGSCTALEIFHFSGTKAEWNSIRKPDTSNNDQTQTNKVKAWDEGMASYIVRCSDGDLNIRKK